MSDELPVTDNVGEQTLSNVDDNTLPNVNKSSEFASSSLQSLTELRNFVTTYLKETRTSQPVQPQEGKKSRPVDETSTTEDNMVIELQQSENTRRETSPIYVNVDDYQESGVSTAPQTPVPSTTATTADSAAEHDMIGISIRMNKEHQTTVKHTANTETEEIRVDDNCVENIEKSSKSGETRNLTKIVSRSEFDAHQTKFGLDLEKSQDYGSSKLKLTIVPPESDRFHKVCNINWEKIINAIDLHESGPNV